jgi:transposase
MLQAVQSMDKKQFITLCKTDPEEVYKLFCVMGETITTLRAEVVLLNEQVETLQEEVKNLKSRLDQNSRNSNKPPSTDEFIKPKSQRKKSGNKTGGQKGHQGHTLEMSDNPDQIISHRPKRCSGCGHDLSRELPGKTERRQVFDIPIPKVEITEHQSETVYCPCCGLLNKGSFPDEVNQPVQYGKGLLAQIIYLNQYQLIPYNRIAEYFEDLYSLKISEATIFKALETIFELLGPAEQATISKLLEAKTLHVDETGMRVEGKRRWLHVASTAFYTNYNWHTKRGSIATEEIGILPRFEGTMVHDFWQPYYHYDCHHSLCNIHNIRELQGISELTGQKWPEEMIELLLKIKERVDSGPLKEKEKIVFTESYDAIISEGYRANPPPKPTKKRGRPKKGRVINMLGRLSEHRHEVLAFMEDFAVPFDNNQAERDIRMMKVKQKISGVFRSTKGADMFCRIRSYISTARKNSVSAFTAIADALDGRVFIPQI